MNIEKLDIFLATRTIERSSLPAWLYSTSFNLSTRKREAKGEATLEQMDKAAAAAVTATPSEASHQDDLSFGGKLAVLVKRELNTDHCPAAVAILCGLAGSILDYKGDAIVNAANTGGVTGSGIDEMINRAGGLPLKQPRKALGRIPTGACHRCRVLLTIHTSNGLFMPLDPFCETMP